MVQTVLGLVDPGSLGKTLMHEHLLLQTWIDLGDRQRWISGGFGIPPETDDELAIWDAELTLENIELLREAGARLRNRDVNTISTGDIKPELLAFRAAGGSTVIDFPPIEPRRDPLALARLSHETGVNIVVGTSYYTEAWHPDQIDELTTDDLHANMLEDIMVGMDGTNIRAGIVGETPADDIQTGLQENSNARILRAAARTSFFFGAALSLHTSAFGRKRPEDLHNALNLIEEEQPDPSIP